VAVNSAVEYWRGDASLSHVGPGPAREHEDLDLPATSRSYLMAGTAHVSGTLPLSDTAQINPDMRAAHLLNVLVHAPLMRAALVNLERWVVDGVEPPPSRVPRVSDGTAVTRAQALAALRKIIGPTPATGALPSIPRDLDLGPDAVAGVARWPAAAGGRHEAYVSAVDADGNEIAGIRLPDVSVPIATHTGWAVRHGSIGAPGGLVRLMGGTFPFAVTREQREAAGDSRPSIAERYRSRADYEQRVRAATAELVRDRYVLEEDTEITVNTAMDRYDAVVAWRTETIPEPTSRPL
jgi:hypothetical protein